MIRITGGHARGRVLKEPVGEGVRPTAAQVREALFSVLGHSLEGTRFLDGFGGAGAVALEAWSRGAVVTVVERDRRTAAAMRRRGAEVGATWTVREGDVLQLAPQLGRFDVVFLDPPYAEPPGPILDRLADLAADTLVYEAEVGTELPVEVGGLTLARHRAYGRRGLWVYTRLAP